MKVAPLKQPGRVCWVEPVVWPKVLVKQGVVVGSHLQVQVVAVFDPTRKGGACSGTSAADGKGRYEKHGSRLHKHKHAGRIHLLWAWCCKDIRTPAHCTCSLSRLATQAAAPHRLAQQQPNPCSTGSQETHSRAGLASFTCQHLAPIRANQVSQRPGCSEEEVVIQHDEGVRQTWQGRM